MMTNNYLSGSSDLEKITKELISADELAGLNPMMAGQSHLPGVNGKNPLELLKESVILTPGLHTQDPEEMEEWDESEDEAPITDSKIMAPPACDPLSCHPMELLKDLAHLLSGDIQKMFQEISKKIKEISLFDKLNPEKLHSKFILLMKISGDDWESIKEDLQIACHQNFHSLSSTISGMLKVYQLQHSKAFNNNITVLGHVTDDLKVTTKRLTAQTEMDRIFNRDITQQINKLTISIAQCMESLDNKTLELHHPSRRNCRNTITPPTADSASSHQRNLPGNLEPLPGVTFKNELMKITLDSNLNITAIINIARAKPLSSICSLPINPRVICKILNQDLEILIKRLQSNPSFFIQFNNLNDKAEKIESLRSMFEEIPHKDNQWYRE
uniref:Uncharacterized protein n=1 Tax=Pararge aegeria TaxID=116150 RepID=S4PC92_9NEOP